MTKEQTPYSDKFYQNQSGGSLTSAKAIVPFILKLFPEITSIVDVGCGIGTWLSVFKRYGIHKVVGADGSYVNQEMLMISPAEFYAVDLSKRVELSERFDLAICLEVAEHLSPDRATDFVKELTALSDSVVFSAAVPDQGGTDHTNEQLPSYWIERFARAGFNCFDCLRPMLWNNSESAVEYKQNIFVFVREGKKAPEIMEQDRPSTFPFDVIHPDLLHHHRVLNKLEVEFIRNGGLGVKDSFRIFMNAMKRRLQ